MATALKVKPLAGRRKFLEKVSLEPAIAKERSCVEDIGMLLLLHSKGG